MHHFSDPHSLIKHRNICVTPFCEITKKSYDTHPSPLLPLRQTIRYETLLINWWYWLRHYSYTKNFNTLTHEFILHLHVSCIISSVKGVFTSGFQIVGKPFKSPLSSVSSNKTYSISCICIKQSVTHCQIARILMGLTFVETGGVLSPTRSLLTLESVRKQVQ